jgi:hypothetical protein
MKCRLQDNPYCDSSFQIEFKSVDEIKDLRDSLSSMIKYINLCIEDKEEIPPLVYKISEEKKPKTIKSSKK